MVGYTVALIGIGSRGDVEPLLSLGSALRARGDRVRVATHGDIAHLVREAGLDYRPLPGSASALFSSPEVTKAMREAPTVRRLARALPGDSAGFEAAAAATATMRRYVDDAVDGADLVVAGPALQESMSITPLSVPHARVSWYPDTPTRRFPAMGAPDLPLGGAYRRLTHAVVSRRMHARQRPFIRAARRRSGLTGRGSRPTPVLSFHLTSAAVMPRPDDWPSDVIMTGPWQSAAPRIDDGPPDAWWDAGDRPIVIGFGSLWPVIPPHWVPRIVSALAAIGRRVVVVGGPPVPRDDAVEQCTTLDFTRRLPQAFVLIHHGGHGTGSSALLGGVPQVITPLFIDHPWWAQRMRRLGAAPKPVPLGAADDSPDAADAYAMRLREAVKSVDERMRVRAGALAEVAGASDGGVEEAADRIEEWFRREGAV